MSTYTLTAFEKTGEKLIDESFEAAFWDRSKDYRHQEVRRAFLFRKNASMR